MFYWLIKLLFWPFARFYFRMTIRGKKNIPKHGPALIASNHSSFLDPACLGSASPRKVHFIIKRKVYKKFMQQWFYRWMETIPVRESEADIDAIKKAIRMLRNGSIVGIFPQGSVSSEEKELSWLNGVSFIAAKAQCPTIPCAIIGTEKALKRHDIFPKPYKIQVIFGKTLFYPAGEETRVKKEKIASFTESLFREMRELKQSGDAEHKEKRV